jgi:hypothetical protein
MHILRRVFELSQSQLVRELGENNGDEKYLTIVQSLN